MCVCMLCACVYAVCVCCVVHLGIIACVCMHELYVTSFILQAAEGKNITPLVATFRNGHYEVRNTQCVVIFNDTLQVVEWLLRYTNHLPSDAECQKCLLAPAPDDADEESRTNLLHNRTKCLELIMKVVRVCVCMCACVCVLVCVCVRVCVFT